MHMHGNRLDCSFYTENEEELQFIKGFSKEIRTLLTSQGFEVHKLAFEFFKGESPILEEVRIKEQAQMGQVGFEAII